ncbi:Chaperonin 10-like protein [Pleurostoma richardsiae]|uniref:Chaperonin 10-like protein n=1 Tax=Pleurostoma richardsiae TaxID=41990 RepID=A0AA38VNI6_9PEZI|nr:Chaperonin 10-like protein [Pleurostoma richardsiae]
MPTISEDEIMIKACYTGLNPIDWKSVDYNFCLPTFPWVTGREMSGIVEKVGSAVDSFRPGDKVWTSTYYRDIRAGCFQQYVVVPSHTVSPVPAQVPLESAACLGVAALTAAMTLWSWLCVPLPSTLRSDFCASHGSDDEWTLIWGGSTITGQFATQLAVLSGLKVITVNSIDTKPLSEKLGASHVVVRDGKTEEELVYEIQSVTGGRVTRAIDVVGPYTASVLLRAVSGGLPVDFAPLAFLYPTQELPSNVTAHTVEMKRFVLDKSCSCYAQELNRLLEVGKLALPEITVLEGGLNSIPAGLELLKKGNMAGRKLVARVESACDA